MSNPLVSVIIPTRNSEGTIEICLKSIKNQTHQNIEIVVVDNNSQDRTKEIAGKYADKVYSKGPERSAQRNFGAEKSQGEYLFFVDSDMELTSRVIEECIDKSRESSALIIPEISVGSSFWAHCKALEKGCYIGDETIEAARFLDKDVFFKVGKWDEDMIAAEDWDLTSRIRREGFKVDRIQSLIKHHEGDLSLIETLKSKYYYGKNVHIYLKKHPQKAKKQYGLVRPSFLRNWEKLVRDPIHAIGMLFMKTCEFGSGGIGHLKSRIER